MSTSLKHLKEVVDGLVEMAEGHANISNVQVKFKTFDERFEENTDEFQEPDTITAVEFDVMNWDKVTITIERKVKHEDT
jgi:hypothetical protein